MRPPNEREAPIATPATEARPIIIHPICEVGAALGVRMPLPSTISRPDTSGVISPSLS
jgi:hypothetical protein